MTGETGTRGRVLLAVVLAVMSVMALPVVAQGTTTPWIDVLGVESIGDKVSVVTALRPAPADPLGDGQVTVRAGGRNLPNHVQPVLSDRSAIALVVDASEPGAPALRDGGLSGAVSFLLQLPAGATTAVIADRQPPTIASAASSSSIGALQAMSDLSSGGDRATSDALTLALRQVPSGAGAQPVIVLYTSAPDAGGEPAAVLGDRLRAANAILAVVTSSPDRRYWTQAATSTGGIAVLAEPEKAIQSFDDVADALRARHVVTFARPPASTSEVQLRFETAGRPSFALKLPPQGSGSSPGDGAWPSWFWIAGGLGAATAVVVGLLVRGGTSGPPVARRL